MEADRSRKHPIVKKLESYLSFKKSNKGGQIVPTGCLTVHVGPKRERFVIKAKCVNHPLFKILLEDAESEYGFRNEGPLKLPCDVDLFYKVLAAMDDRFDDCPGGYGGCSPFNPGRRLARSGGSYGRLVPLGSLKIKTF